MPLNLLDESLIELVPEDRGAATISLPGLFAAWGAGQDIRLGRLRRHNQHAMHMFLCQLAAAGVQRHKPEQGLAASEDVWKQRLLALAPLKAWDLIHDDWKTSAFLQPGLPNGNMEGMKVRDAETPDDVTMLVVTERSQHSVKRGRLKAPEAWDWIQSLVEFQTMAWYLGVKNYGVARSGSGWEGRLMVAVYPDMREGARWARDVKGILAKMEAIRDIHPGYAPGPTGVVALWTIPWDAMQEGSGVQFSQLDPLFIDCARPAKLILRADGSILARLGTSLKARVAGAKELQGATGDPWCPLIESKKGIRPPGVREAGWQLDTLVNLIVPQDGVVLKPAPLQSAMPGETGLLTFYGATTSVAKGKVLGYHEAIIPVPGRIQKVIFGPKKDDAGAQKLGHLSKTMLALSKEVRDVLYVAMLPLFLTPDEREAGKKIPDKNARWKACKTGAMAAYDASVRNEFFPHLWAAFDANDAQGWRDFLRKHAQEVLSNVIERYAIPQKVGWQGPVEARSILQSGMNKVVLADKEAKPPSPRMAPQP